MASFRNEYIIEAPATVITAADAADPNGQSAAVAEARHISLQDRAPDGQKTFGHALVLIAKADAAGGGNDISGVTFDFTIWLYDDKNAQYYKFFSTADTGATALPTRRLLSTQDARRSTFVIQLTAINSPGSTDSVICRLCEI